MYSPNVLPLEYNYFFNLPQSHQITTIFTTWLMTPIQADAADPLEVLSEAAEAAAAAWAVHPAWGVVAGSKEAREEVPGAPEDRGAGPEEEDQVG